MIIGALAKQCQGIIDLRGDKVPAGDGLLVGAAYAPGDVIEILYYLAVMGAHELVGIVPLIPPPYVKLQESPSKSKTPVESPGAGDIISPSGVGAQGRVSSSLGGFLAGNCSSPSGF